MPWPQYIHADRKHRGRKGIQNRLAHQDSFSEEVKLELILKKILGVSEINQGRKWEEKSKE